MLAHYSLSNSRGWLSSSNHRVLTTVENQENSGNFLIQENSEKTLYNCLEIIVWRLRKTWKTRGLLFCQICMHPEQVMIYQHHSSWCEAWSCVSICLLLSTFPQYLTSHTWQDDVLPHKCAVCLLAGHIPPLNNTFHYWMTYSLNDAFCHWMTHSTTEWHIHWMMHSATEWLVWSFMLSVYHLWSFSAPTTTVEPYWMGKTRNVPKV